MDRSLPSNDDGVDQRFRVELARACRLAASEASVNAIHVYIGRRPTYAEIAQLREEASRGGLGVVIHADGRVSIRKHVGNIPVAGVHPDDAPIPAIVEIGSRSNPDHTFSPTPRQG